MSESSSSPPSAGGRLLQRLLVALVGLGILAVASWLALIIVTRVDELFLPGQEIPVGPLAALPGVEDEADLLGKRINILVMGLDRQPREGDAPTRTDTMFVLTIDAQSQTAGILGIPRDLWVEIPYRDGSGFYQARINIAYVTGETREYPGGGPGVAREVIEHNLGIPIDHYVIVDFPGFVELVDALGGIDVYVPEPVRDPLYLPAEQPGRSVVSFEVGLHHMDGQTALDYSRIRYGSSDFERIQRQQRVIFAAIDKAKELNFVDVNKLIDLAGKYRNAIETDINDFQFPGFAALAAQIDPDRITALSLGAATVPWVTPTGAEVLLFDEQLVQQIIQALFSDQRLLEEDAFVEVQNGAGTDGLASRAVDYLANFGFPTGSLTAADTVDGTVRPRTVIIDFSGNDYTVERLATLLEVPAVWVRHARPGDDAQRTTEADILVILGADAQAGPLVSDASGG